MARPIHVVGGGLAGLVAAVTAAEAGAPVVVHEAADRPGGRALGGTDRRGVNLGPHVVFSDGALVRWLSAHHIEVGLRRAPVRGVRLLDDRGPHLPLGEGLALAGTLRPAEAPVDETFRSWTDHRFGPRRSDLLCRLAGLYTYHHDPGSLSARFVWDRYRRAFLSPDRVRWVAGGWDQLIAALARRATGLGVEVRTGDRVTADDLPAGPVIVAVPLGPASRLVGRALSWPGGRAALLDVIAGGHPGWPTLLADVRSDITTCCMVERETAVEPGLVDPEGAELFQAHLGIPPGVGIEAGTARIESALDAAVPGWRDRVLWQRGHLAAGATGALDPPGTTWRDRPAVDQGQDRFLAGDAVAVPGLLSEVSVNSAVRAAHLALEARRRRVYAPGWPAAELTAERRLAVLAAVLPGAATATTTWPAARTGPTDRDLEPVDETGPGYRLVAGRGGLRGMAVAGGEGARTLRLLVSGPGARVLARYPRLGAPGRAALRAVLGLRRPR